MQQASSRPLVQQVAHYVREQHDCCPLCAAAMHTAIARSAAQCPSQQLLHERCWFPSAAPQPLALPAAPCMCFSQQLLHKRSCCIRCCATAATSGERCCIPCCATAATSGSRHVLQPTAAALAQLHSLLRHRRYQRPQACAAANSCCTSAAAFAAAPPPLPAAPCMCCGQQLLH